MWAVTQHQLRFVVKTNIIQLTVVCTFFENRLHHEMFKVEEQAQQWLSLFLPVCHLAPALVYTGQRQTEHRLSRSCTDPCATQCNVTEETPKKRKRDRLCSVYFVFVPCIQGEEPDLYRQTRWGPSGLAYTSGPAAKPMSVTKRAVRDTIGLVRSYCKWSYCWLKREGLINWKESWTYLFELVLKLFIKSAIAALFLSEVGCALDLRVM